MKATKEELESYRNAIALVRAAATRDGAGTEAVLRGVEDDGATDGMLAALAEIVTAAFLADPRMGLDRFLDVLGATVEGAAGE